MANHIETIGRAAGIGYVAGFYLSAGVSESGIVTSPDTLINHPKLKPYIPVIGGLFFGTMGAVAGGMNVIQRHYPRYIERINLGGAGIIITFAISFAILELLTPD